MQTPRPTEAGSLRYVMLLLRHREEWMQTSRLAEFGSAQLVFGSIVLEE
jgi:hypothetical protein